MAWDLLIRFSEMDFRKTTLENGLRVVTLSQPAARSVTLGLVVEAGTSVERPDQRGIAHLVEHMIFQGSSNRDALEIARLMDGAGGRVGAFTGRDYSCFFAQVLEEFLPLAIDLLGDVLLNPVFPDDALEREKRAIVCEAQAHRDNPELRVHELLKSSFWPGHPLGRPLIGEGSDLNALTREDLIYFLHTHYQPNRMILAAAGALHHEDFVAQVRDAFWRLIGERAPQPQRPPESRPTLILESAPFSQAYFNLGIEAPAYAHEDRYAAHLASQILGGGISSRLFSSLRERHGLVYHVASTYDAWRDAGLLTVEGSTASADFPQVLDLVLDEVDALFRGRRPINEEELHRAKIRLRSQIQLAAEDSHALMSRIATQELYFGRHLSEEEILGSFEALDIKKLSHFLNNSLAPALDGAGLAVVGDTKDQKPALRQILAKTCSEYRNPSPGLRTTA